MLVVFTGTSLTTGYLAANWAPYLNAIARTFPECKGPIFILNMGHGGWTSLDILANAPNVASKNPTHILFEGGAINDCFDSGSGPAVSRATHIADIQAMVSAWRANNPAVDLTLQTMSSVSTYQIGRPQLGTYYADELTTAAGLSVPTIDNYSGWPKPLNGLLTHGAAPFSITPTAGYAGFDGAQTWDGSRLGSTILIGEDGFTISRTVGGASSEAAQAAEPASGLIHFETTIQADLSGSVGLPFFGVGSHSVNLNAFLGGANNSVALLDTGTVTFPGGSGSAGFTCHIGGTYACEVDTANQLVYFMDGSTRSAGFTSAGIAGSLYPTMAIRNTGLLTPKFSEQGDGLHPILTGAVDTYLEPNVIAWLRAKMAAFWP